MVNTNDIYYAYFDGDTTQLRSFKVVSLIYIFHDKKTMLTLNVAGLGTRTIVLEDYKYGYFFSNSVNEAIHGHGDRVYMFNRFLEDEDWAESKHERYNIISELERYGFHCNIERNMFTYTIHIDYYKMISGNVCQSYINVFELYWGKYDILNHKFITEPKYEYVKQYKTEQECLKANMPKVVDFTDDELKDKDVEQEYTISIKVKAKSLAEAKAKISIK